MIAAVIAFLLVVQRALARPMGLQRLPTSQTELLQ
jgi:hypothetical protein